MNRAERDYHDGIVARGSDLGVDKEREIEAKRISPTRLMRVEKSTNIYCKFRIG